MQPARFLGSSLDDIRAFPEHARREVGFQLDKVQKGRMPDRFRPMHTVGSGVFEIKIDQKGQAHRVFFVAKFASAVYVLHAFEKKSRKTSKKDIDTGRRRYQQLKASLS